MTEIRFASFQILGAAAILGFCVFSLSGCGLFEQNKDEKVDGQSACPTSSCPKLVVSYSQKLIYDCNSQVTGTGYEVYDSGEELITVESGRNIPIDKGEFLNTRNGSQNNNHEDGSAGTLNKQRVYVSAGDRPQCMRLERGDNVVHYKYLTCEAGTPAACTDWAIQEEGDRTVTLWVRGVVKFKCDQFPVCINGQIDHYMGCRNFVELRTPFTLYSDF